MFKLVVSAVLAFSAAVLLFSDRVIEGHTVGPQTTNNQAGVNFDMIMDLCNSSFSIPMDYLTEFNNTAALPDETDKTGMCYIRCVYENSGLIRDWKLNKDLIQQTMWPATGDSIEVCENEGRTESNACTRLYAIAKCLTIRAIVDARDKQVV